MNEGCECPASSKESCTYEGQNENKLPDTNLKTIIVDFGKVAVCGEYVKTFTFENLKNKETVSYRIRRDSKVNSIYHMFTLNKTEGFIKPGECLKLKITYRPTIPHEKNRDTFEFVDSSFNIIIIKTAGESLGPLLRASVKQLKFFVTPPNRTSKRTFELKNIADVPAEFIFECNREQSTFEVEPVSGTLQGKKHMYVTINFIPQEEGSFSKQLFCLTWCGEPVVIELFGICMEDLCPQDLKHFQCYPFPFEDTIGYGAYLLDSVTIRDIFRPITLNKCHVDFERVVKNESTATSLAQVTSLTNEMENPVSVYWPKDDVFNVVPKFVKIEPFNSVIFECYFSPTESNAFYSKMLTAQVDWTTHHKPSKKHHRDFVIPISTTLRLQGHSFPETETWIPNIEVLPSVITLPPCLPGNTSNSNFKIRTIGHLPVMYKLISPKKTSVTMKPMVGIIYTYVVIVAQLSTENQHEGKVYTEQWYIELNGRKEKQIPLCVRGEAAVPTVLIGENNIIKFPCIQPGCQSILPVPIRNTSSLHIRYKFDDTQYKNLEITPSEGDMPSNEEIYVTYCYTGNMCMPRTLHLHCKLQTIQKLEELIGKPYSHSFTVLTKCVYSELCATPNHHNFGDLRLGTPIETEFYMFNFGESTIFYQINICYHTYNADCLNVEPSFGEVAPGEKVRIRIKGIAQTLGERKIYISYGNRKNRDSMEMTKGRIIDLFEIRYNSGIPILQIEEIVEHNFGPLFGKKHLWKYLQINNLNDILNDMVNEEFRSIVLHLPEYEVCEEEYYITLLLRNVSPFETNIILKRKQTCDCSLKEVPVNINKTKKMFDCPHREMLTMSLVDSDGKFYENTQLYLTIEIKYTVPGQTTMTYLLQMEDDRCVEISFLIYAIPIEVNHISSYEGTYNITLRNVSVRRKVAPLQFFWMYNNSKQVVRYKMDTTELLHMCQKDGFEVLKCMNPEGEIQPYRPFPLMIKFHPIEIKEYDVVVPLTLGDTTIGFHIQGTGQAKKNRQEFSYAIPPVSRGYHKFPVTLSCDFIIINCILTWSTTEHLIFLKNVTKDRIVQYHWLKGEIEGILEVTTDHKSGMLEPKESHAVVIKTKTFNVACITNFLISCIIIDYTQYVLHKKSVEAFLKRQEQIEAEFTITEEGITHEPNEVPLVDPPEPFTITLSLSINIFHINDRNFITMEEQLVCSPRDDINVNISNVLNEWLKCSKKKAESDRLAIEKIKVQDKARISKFLEQLIANVVFSKEFMEILRMAHNVPPPIYSQFTMDDLRVRAKDSAIRLSNDDLLEIRKKEVQKALRKPKPSLVADTFKGLIVDGIYETFKLPPRLLPQKDIDKEAENLLHICPTDFKCRIHEEINKNN